MEVVSFGNQAVNKSNAITAEVNDNKNTVSRELNFNKTSENVESQLEIASPNGNTVLKSW